VTPETAQLIHPIEGVPCAFDRSWLATPNNVSRSRRTLLASLIFSRPWRISPEHGAAMNHATASAPGFLPTLPNVHRWRPSSPVCPATVAWGERDRLLIYSRQAPRAARLLPRARHVTLTGCGHVPMTDDPGQVARVILETSAA